MANTCYNELHIVTDDTNNTTIILFFLKRHFSNTKILKKSKDVVEVSFDSYWTFPEELMNELYKVIPNKEDILIDCLSVEWGNFYCEFSHCNKNGWYN